MAPDEVDPLPEGDRQDILQQLSINALANAFPVDRFLIRKEEANDKGVDGSLEVKVEIKTDTSAGPTSSKWAFKNFRAQYQLKSTDSTEINTDGSVSFSIKTRNLNYLLSGPCPIYFLWMEQLKQMRYAWARGEWNRLDRDNPDWKNQGTFTVRFSNILDATAFDEIHDQIIKEAKLNRRINETLSQSSLSERVVVAVDPKNLQSTDPREIYNWLSESGMTIVAAGFGLKVTELFEFINPGQKREAKLRLVAAYACASLGRNAEAEAHLSVAALKRSDLPEYDQRFLDYLRDVCGYQTGRIDLAEYLEREQKWSDSNTGVFAAEHQLEILRQKRLVEQNLDTREQLFQQMRVESRVFDSEPTTAAHKIKARLLMLNAEGDDLSLKFIENSGLCRVRGKMGFDARELYMTFKDDMEKSWREWAAKAQELISDSTVERHPILIADAITMRLAVLVNMLLYSQQQSASGNEAWKPDEGILPAFQQEAICACDIYRTAGTLEGETRARLLLVDLLELDGKAAEAKVLADECLVVTEAMGYSGLTKKAREHSEGNTPLKKFQAALNLSRSEDPDFHMAKAPDGELRKMAGDILKALGLPPERLKFLEIELFSQRRLCKEQVKFCQHLQMNQDRAHLKHPSTFFQADPVRYCGCMIHPYRSRNPSNHADYVIDDFKQTFCDSCSDNSPKN
jgi:hypothetical protein